MKNLIFLTSHRQIQEVYLYAKFLQRTKYAKDFDIVLHNNNRDIDVQTLQNAFNTIPNKNKYLILTDKNDGGYYMGCHEAISDFFELFKAYDNVIHSTSDVFIVNEDPLLAILNSEPNTAFLVNRAAGSDPTMQWMSVDLFIMRPKFLTENIFNSWKDITDMLKYQNPTPGKTHIGPEFGAETLLYNQIIDNNLTYKYIKRYDTDHWNPRRLDMWGCWHEHDLNKLIKQ